MAEAGCFPGAAGCWKEKANIPLLMQPDLRAGKGCTDINIFLHYMEKMNKKYKTKNGWKGS